MTSTAARFFECKPPVERTSAFVSSVCLAAKTSRHVPSPDRLPGKRNSVDTTLHRAPAHCPVSHLRTPGRLPPGQRRAQDRRARATGSGSATAGPASGPRSRTGSPYAATSPGRCCSRSTRGVRIDPAHTTAAAPSPANSSTPASTWPPSSSSWATPGSALPPSTTGAPSRPRPAPPA